MAKFKYAVMQLHFDDDEDDPVVLIVTQEALPTLMGVVDAVIEATEDDIELEWPDEEDEIH